MGGFEDGDEPVLRETTGLTQKDNDPNWSTSDTHSSKFNGDRVLVTFVQGSQENPVIVGVLPHPATQYGGTKKKGIRRFMTHRGSSTEIQSDGTINIVLKDKQKINITSKNTSLVIDDDAQTTTIVDKDKVTVVLDGKNKKITVDANGAAKAIFDGNQKSVEIDADQASIKMQNNEIDLAAGGGMNVNVGGNSYAVIDTTKFFNALFQWITALDAALMAGTQGTPVAQMLTAYPLVSSMVTQPFLNQLTAAVPLTSNIVKAG
jgi:hypothetical protein